MMRETDETQQMHIPVILAVVDDLETADNQIAHARALGQIDSYITKPWGAPEVFLYAGLTELLSEWAQTHLPGSRLFAWSVPGTCPRRTTFATSSIARDPFPGRRLALPRLREVGVATVPHLDRVEGKIARVKDAGYIADQMQATGAAKTSTAREQEGALVESVARQGALPGR